MAYTNIISQSIHDSDNEDLSRDEKHYTDLSPVNLSNSFINTQLSSTYNNDLPNMLTSNEKEKSEIENISSFHLDDFWVNSSYSKEMCTESSGLEILKRKQEMGLSKDDSLGIDADFDSSYNDSEPKSKDETTLVTDDSAGIEADFDSSHSEYGSNVSQLVNNEDSKMNLLGIEKLALVNSTMNSELSCNTNSEDKITNCGDVINPCDNDNMNVDMSVVKTEVPEENLENMITILVPQDVDMKNIKIEPEDPTYEKVSFLDDEEIHEIDDSEDFYIIQVQDPANADNSKESKHTKRNANKGMPVNNQQLSKCDQCVYQTYDKSNLRKHKLIHTDLKPYSCNKCSFTCKLPKYLKQHMITHMTVRLFPCTVCCHRCRNLTELNRHIKRHLKLNRKTSIDELTEQEKTYCVCRDGCKTAGGFSKKIKREKKDDAYNNNL